MNNLNKKPKIGILTFHKSINYGAFLQAYALSKRIKSDFDVDVEIIDFEYLKKNIWHKLIVLKRSKIKYLWKYFNQYIAFRKSLKYLPLSNKRFVNTDTKAVSNFINKRYDYVIVGSDAVWSYNNFKMGVRNIYFLKEIKSKKISYAACAFGIDYNNISQYEKQYIRNSLNEFDYIGVRDSGTLQFVKDNCDFDNKIFKNCDPTILLKKPGKEHLTSIIKRFKIDITKPIIGLMIDNEIISKRIKDEFGNKYTYISLFNRNKYADYFLNDLTPFEWSEVFQLFEILFTSYFHGSILGLKNEIPVISVQGFPYNEKYISKIEQIFFDLDLAEYCFIESKIDEAQIDKMMKLAKNTLNNRNQIIDKIKIGLINEEKNYKSFYNYLESELGINK